MRILIWTQHFYPENFRINEVAKGLVREGESVTVLTGKPNYPIGNIFEGYKITGIQQENLDGIDIIRIPLIPRKSGSWKRLIVNYLSFIFSGYLFAPLALKGKKFDSIFVYATSPLLQALPAIFISWIKGAKLSIWVQDLWPQSLRAAGFINNRFTLWLVELVVLYIYARADSIFIQSEGFRSKVEQLVKDKTKIHYLPNPAEELEIYVSKQKREFVEQISQNFSVVFAGNIGAVQSCETIIDAAEILRNYPEIKFYLIGRGSRFSPIALDVVKRNLTNVNMISLLPPEEMPAIFVASSALLVTLKDDPDLSKTIPSKLQSYLSSGKPIIACLNGAAAEIIEESCSGIVCKADNAKGLADAVLKLYKMIPEEREQLGINGRQCFEKKYRLSLCVSKIIEYLR